MTDTKDVNVEVRGEDIIITAPGTDHLVIYSKRENSVELRLGNCTDLWIFACELGPWQTTRPRNWGGLSQISGPEQLRLRPFRMPIFLGAR